METASDPPEDGGSVLYLEADEIDPMETFCTEVFEGEKAGEYRVVQLTATESFESLTDALNAQLEQIRDPSEAAVIITTPQTADESETTEVGAGTPLYGFRVSPQDLTGISVAFSRLVDNWESSAGSIKICLRDIESLLPYHDPDLIYRFLNTVLATLQGGGADVHAHFRPAATDEQTLKLIASLFDHVIDMDDSTLTAVTDADGVTDDPEATAAQSDSEASTQFDEADESGPGGTAEYSGGTTAMTDEEIDTFLADEGYGILAFGGSSPYAIPMSYGYDPERRVLYSHMSTFEGSEKHSRLESSADVSMVVVRYERPDQWRSVVVEGTLSRLSTDAVREQEVLDTFRRSELASVDVFTRDLSNVSFDWFVLTPSTMEGRQSTRRRESGQANVS